MCNSEELDRVMMEDGGEAGVCHINFRLGTGERKVLTQQRHSKRTNPLLRLEARFIMAVF